MPVRRQATVRASLIAALALALSAAALAPAETNDPIPPERSVDWSLAGQDAAFPSEHATIDFLQAGGNNNWEADNAPLLQSLIDGLDQPTVIVFPPGDYLFQSPIRIDASASNAPLILRGSGPQRSRLRFDVQKMDTNGLVNVRGHATGRSARPVGNVAKGDRSLEFSTPHPFQPGETLVLSQANDLDAMGTYLSGNGMPERQIEALQTWAARSVGQTVVVESIHDARIDLRYPLTLDYQWDDRRLDTIQTRDLVGIEDLAIHNQTDTDGLHTIVFDRAANCWVSNVHSHRTVKMHLVITRSRNCLVRGSVFSDSFRHGGGGHGYGVVAGKYANHCLVENNRFDRLRHSMMIKEGANANVFAYNYSFDGLQDGAPVAKDISVHGHYPFMNLFEGNKVEYIHSADYWGAAGPGNTFFRNEVTVAALHLEDYSPQQNAIGNDLPPIPQNAPWFYRADSSYRLNGVVIGDEVIDPLVFANRVHGESPDDPVRELPPSLYLDAPPDFWQPGLPWPPFGPGSEIDQGQLPAETASLPHASWQNLPNWSGTNLLNRFHLDWQNRPFSEADFALIADFGFNFVRLPIDYRVYTETDDWLAFDESVLQNLDQAIAWANRLGIHVQLNLHRIPGYTVASPAEPTSLWTDAATQAAAAAHWAMFAARYSDLPNSHLSFNLLNEPAGQVTADQYAAVVSKIADAIRDLDPDRLIVADGLDYATEPVPELIPLQVAQSFHMYEPFNLTHYRARWVTGSDDWAEPTWPSNTVSAYLYAPAKPDLHSDLIIDAALPVDATFRIRVGIVSIRSLLEIHADDQLVFQRDFQPGPGDGEWSEFFYNETYDIYQNLYLKDYYAEIPAGTEKIIIRNAEGDWMTFLDFGIAVQGSSTERTLVPGNASYGSRQDTDVHFDASQNPAFSTDDPSGFDQIWRDRIAPWLALKQQGVGVMAGEWGVHNQTPHAVTLAWTRDLLEAFTAADIGWAQWDFYGSFGPFDSGRTDVDYQSYRGRRLDRAMMGLLQEFAHQRISYRRWAENAFAGSTVPSDARLPESRPVLPLVSNLACYAHGLDPLNPDLQRLPRLLNPSALAIDLSPHAAGLRLALLSSSDLVRWSALSTPLDPPDLRLPTPDPASFLRFAYFLAPASD